MNGPCNTVRADIVCVNQLRFAGLIDSGILRKRPDVKIQLPYNFFFYEPEDLYRPDTYQTFLSRYLTSRRKIISLWSLKKLSLEKEYFCFYSSANSNTNDFTCRQHLVRRSTITPAFSDRWYPTRSILQQWKPSCWLFGALYLLAHSRYSIECRRWICARWHKYLVKLILNDFSLFWWRLIHNNLSLIIFHSIASPATKFIASVSLARIRFSRHRYGWSLGYERKKYQYGYYWWSWPERYS